jgi:hypothetical protein
MIREPARQPSRLRMKRRVIRSNITAAHQRDACARTLSRALEP